MQPFLSKLLLRATLPVAALFATATTTHAQTLIDRPSFSIVGFVQELDVENLTEPLSKGSMTVNGIKIILPANLLITMPGQYLTVNDLFKGKHPKANAAATKPSGLALKDVGALKPRLPIEATVIGNVVDGEYRAGVVRVAQLGLQTSTGIIKEIVSAEGAMVIESGTGSNKVTTKVIINDPDGNYGKPNKDKFGGNIDHIIDERFAADPENAPIRAETGYPMCLPLFKGGNNDDDECPGKNRLPETSRDRNRFTCGTTAAEPTSPAHGRCDPRKMVPLVKGDYITYSGMLTEAADGTFFVAAHAVVAMVGIYTSPGTDPAYVTIEEALMGTSGFQDPNIPQEATGRIKFVGFTTDPSRDVTLMSVEYDKQTGAEIEDVISTVTPQRLGQIGRLRIDIRPPRTAVAKVPRDARIKIIPFTKVSDVPRAGTFIAPINEYIYPENTLFGWPNRPTSIPFDFFCFLKDGAGPLNTLGRKSSDRKIGPLDPFPESTKPNPAPTVCP